MTMRNEPTEGGWDAAVRAIEAEATARCEQCGTERRPGDPILCRVCGEPVLDEGWAP
jgi:hypothetical protein